MPNARSPEQVVSDIKRSEKVLGVKYSDVFRSLAYRTEHHLANMFKGQMRDTKLDERERYSVLLRDHEELLKITNGPITYLNKVNNGHLLSLPLQERIYRTKFENVNLDGWHYMTYNQYSSAYIFVLSTNSDYNIEISINVERQIVHSITKILETRPEVQQLHSVKN